MVLFNTSCINFQTLRSLLCHLWRSVFKNWTMLKMCTARASRLNEVILRLAAATRDDGRVREAQPPEEAEINITILYSFLNSLVGDRQLPECSADFYDVGYERGMSVDIKDTKLGFIYQLERKLQQQQVALAFPSPNKIISMRGHEIINRLVFTRFKEQELFRLPILLNSFQNTAFTFTGLNSMLFQGLQYTKRIVMDNAYATLLMINLELRVVTTVVSRCQCIAIY